ncbi:sugar-transfer associated ATP-grasp domain-containing protein [Arhodomonas sp. SL1]|uniref:sugar-transfer associated ATP-grasp domain-containing protein n=1 Tax=Arhodomonas sp. SL1 TaxID=3425691 RepID=UPI003F881ACD
MSSLRESYSLLRDATAIALSRRANPARTLLRLGRLCTYGHFSPTEVRSLALLDPWLSAADLRAYRSKEHTWPRLVDWNGDRSRSVDDKLAFHHACRAANLPVAQLFAVADAMGIRWIEPPAGVDPNEPPERLETLIDALPGEFVVKPSYGLKGYGVRVFRREGRELVDSVGGRWPATSAASEMRKSLTAPTMHARYQPNDHALLLQARLTPHPSLVTLAASRAIQTVRICTLAVSGQPARVLFAFLKVVAAGNVLDNFRAGQSGNLLAYPDYENGRLYRVVGPPRPGALPSVLEYHPDSGVTMIGFEVPAWKAAVALALRAAERFQPLSAIGWDIAITPEGPLLLEGNGSWDPVAPWFTRP